MAYIVGTANSDTLAGTAGADTILGMAGDDILLGQSGNDELSGGAGNDTVDGGDGDDVLNASGEAGVPDTGIDTLIGGAGNDRIVAGYGDGVDGGAGIDSVALFFFGASAGVNADFRQLAGNGAVTIGGATLRNLEHVSYLSLTDFADTIIAGVGPANPGDIHTSLIIDGYGGNDRLTGSDARDLISGGDGDDVIRGGTGYNAGVFPGGDRLYGDAGNDIIHGGADASLIGGGAGNDQIYGGAGAEEAFGDDGADYFDMGAGDDGAQGGAGQDLIMGGAGDDTLAGGNGRDVLDGGAGSDTLYGGANDVDDQEVDTLYGRDGDDAIAGNAGDTIDGGAGVDSLSLFFAPRAAAVTADFTGVDTGASVTLAGGTISGIEEITSLSLTGGDDRVTLGFQTAGAASFVYGGGGADRLIGSLREDYLYGEAGDDALYGAGGADTLDGGEGADLIDGGAGDDFLIGESPSGAGGDDLRGFGGADRLFGGSGADTLAGGSGDDVLDGGADVDEAVFGGALALSRFEFPAGDGIVVTGADGRDTVTGVERLRFADRAVDVTVAAPVAVLYAVFGGREATAAERDYWTGELSAGRTTVAGVKAAILADPLGQANTAAVVSGLYRAYLGREPGGAELAYWDGQVRGGTEFAGVRAAIVADPAGPAFVAGAIGRLYRDYGGRDASSDEVGYWTEQVRGGASFADVRGAILADSLGQGHAAAVIGSLYAEYLGRPAGASDIAYWSAEVRGGLEFAGVRAGLVNDASGRAHTAAVVAELYRDYGGREAGAGELAFWDGQVRGGASFADVRGAILADSLGQGHAAVVIGSLYAEHLGRPAGASDIAYWSAEVRGGLDFAGVRAGLVNDASGRGHTAAVVAELYRDYGGREAGAGELAFWDGQVRGGASFADVRGAILADSLGRSYTTAALDGLYAELFGRGAGASDQAAWAGLFRAGADLDTARAALMTDAGSAGRVTQAAGSGAADRFVFVATDRHLAVSGFDPAADVLDLRGSGFTSYAAREVRNLDGRTDVLVTLDATHDVLLRGVALSQLGTDDVLI